jgi:hypothetical protein
MKSLGIPAIAYHLLMVVQSDRLGQVRPRRADREKLGPTAEEAEETGWAVIPAREVFGLVDVMGIQERDEEEFRPDLNEPEILACQVEVEAGEDTAIVDAGHPRYHVHQGRAHQRF